MALDVEEVELEAEEDVGYWGFWSNSINAAYKIPTPNPGSRNPKP